MLVTVWKTVGYPLVIYLAGLQAIPGDFYEAAALDGATGWKRFRFITWPLLSPTTLFLVVTLTIASFQGFDIVKIMTGGGPDHLDDDLRLSTSTSRPSSTSGSGGPRPRWWSSSRSSCC